MQEYADTKQTNVSDQRGVPIQKKENKKGIPNSLKAGIEPLSEYAIDDGKVHYNSPEPSQLQAHAYAQGANIHISVGQERHLPHEAWHVVQQKQERIKPTTQLTGTPINNAVGLENEVDIMGLKATQIEGRGAGIWQDPNKRGANTTQHSAQRTTIQRQEATDKPVSLMWATRPAFFQRFPYNHGATFLKFPDETMRSHSLGNGEDEAISRYTQIRNHDYITLDYAEKISQEFRKDADQYQYIPSNAESFASQMVPGSINKLRNYFGAMGNCNDHQNRVYNRLGISSTPQFFTHTWEHVGKDFDNGFHYLAEKSKALHSDPENSTLV